MNKMVSVKRAVLESLQDVGMEDWNQSPIVMRWCANAEEKIAGKYDYKVRRIVKEVKNLRELQLPSNTYKVLSVFAGIVGQDTDYVWSNIYGNISSFDPSFSFNNVDIGGALSIVYGTNLPSSLDEVSIGSYSVINNKIVFDSDVSAVTDMTIFTLAYQEDEEGFVMVGEQHIPAISAYVKYMLGERSQFGANPMPDGVIRRLHQRWTQEKKSAQVKTIQMPPAEREMMSRIANNPISGKVIDYHGDYSEFIQ